MHVNCSFCLIADFWWYCVLSGTLHFNNQGFYVVPQCFCYAHSFVQLKTLLPVFSLGLFYQLQALKKNFISQKKNSCNFSYSGQFCWVCNYYGLSIIPFQDLECIAPGSSGFQSSHCEIGCYFEEFSLIYDLCFFSWRFQNIFVCFVYTVFYL